MSKKVYYFAYGSNMDKERMIKRGVHFSKRFKGILNGFKLSFEEVSFYYAKSGVATISKKKEFCCRGCSI